MSIETSLTETKRKKKETEQIIQELKDNIKICKVNIIGIPE